MRNRADTERWTVQCRSDDLEASTNVKSQFHTLFLLPAPGFVHCSAQHSWVASSESLPATLPTCHSGKKLSQVEPLLAVTSRNYKNSQIVFNNMLYFSLKLHRLSPIIWSTLVRTINYRSPKIILNNMEL